LSQGSLKIDSRRVAHETVDDETIMIDMESGSYYSLRGSGPEIWGMIVSGATVGDIAGELERRYPDASPSASLLDLVDELKAEGLVAAADGNVSAAAPLGAAAPSGGEFLEPELTKFTDLQELLLLDPVHEIDEAGWPHAPPS
jgi:Coenzyme PQQ synthesis protein D (PqqD)